jgi:MFS family permease
MTRAGYVLLSAMLATIALIGYVWWPLLAEAVGTFNPNYPWWRQVDWLLLGIFVVMTVLILIGADLRRDVLIAAVGLGGGLVIESWGTQTGLWTYYTLERPPLWILPAWPVASLAIDRLTMLVRRLTDRLAAGPTTLVYLVIFGGFASLMVPFVWHTRYASLTIAALVLCAFLVATPIQPRMALATFIAGAGLGYFLERWGTTRQCWSYYTRQTPPLFAVLAHGMAAVAFWRTSQAIQRVFSLGTQARSEQATVRPAPTAD